MTTKERDELADTQNGTLAIIITGIIVLVVLLPIACILA